MRSLPLIVAALLGILLTCVPATAEDAPAATEPAATEAPAEAPVPAEVAAETVTPAAPGDEDPSEHSWQDATNDVFGAIVGYIAPVLFWEVPLTTKPVVDEAGNPVYDEDGEPETALTGIPLIILVLVLGGLFFTLRYGFVNLRLFRHGIQCVRGKFDNPDDDGEVSHFKALTSALSATVGLGNIAGVAVAITMGGPGAVFWMWLVAFFGMSMKFTSCTFAQLYRRVKADGSVLGGPMVYLEEGLKERGLAPLGKIMAVVFAVLCIGASFGGGNMFQGNQAYSMFNQAFLDGEGGAIAPWIVGVTLAILVSVVIIGGIKRIGEVTSKLVPLMCGFYCIVCLIIILANIGNVGHMFAEIFTQAFSPEAAFGGFLGVLIQGMKRAAFSNEAGLGSAAIAHAAAKTKEPVREGLVAMLGPFIDTIVVCTMTALAILITDAHLTTDKEVAGVMVTAAAFDTLGGAVPYVLFLAVVIFAYSTMISWAYYGERATEYLAGEQGILPYRICYCIVVVLGPVLSLGAVVDFADMMLLSMAFPNIIGMAILSPKIVGLLKDYQRRLKSGEMHLSSDWRVHHPDDAKVEDAGGKP